MFSGTILENIKLDNKTNIDEIEKTSIDCEIKSDIERFENGYDTLIGEKGRKISGGQKQRICIARSLVSNKPILILDEALNKLDNKTRKDKLKKLKQMYNDSGYHKQFTILFIIIELTAIIEIITIPYITKKMINIEIPNKNIKALVILGVIYIAFLLLQCYMVLKHCNMRSILKRKIQRDLREKVFNKMQDVKTKFYDENETGVILQFLQTDVNDSGALFPEIVV